MYGSGNNHNLAFLVDHRLGTWAIVSGEGILSNQEDLGFRLSLDERKTQLGSWFRCGCRGDHYTSDSYFG